MDRSVSVYFTDGKKTIDFVLVYKKSSLLENDYKLRKFEKFTDNIKKIGLIIEIEPFEVDTNVIFVKIHAPDSSVILYSTLCDVDLASRTMAYRPITKPPPHFMATPLTNPDPNDPLVQRAPESMLSAIPTGITSAEKILVVFKLLLRLKFGEDRKDFGIGELRQGNIIFDYFPIHDGPYVWTDTGPLSDRQILAKYWGNYTYWYKQQPMNLIVKYYGPEVGFYFAWMQHYVKMLIIPGFLSILILIYGIATITTHENIRSKEICESQLVLCPRWHYSTCNFEHLNSTCIISNITYLFDNTATIFFAIFMSLWSTVFMELWQRNEAVLKLQWNVKEVEYDTTPRTAFLVKAKKQRYSIVTDFEEPYIPTAYQCIWYTVTIVIILLLLGMVVGVVLGVMIYRITVNTLLLSQSQEHLVVNNRGIIASASGGFISAIFILIFKQIFQMISLWLTNIENHRTEREFDNAYIFKNYGFQFVNNYGVVFYIAFFKGRFYTHPGDIALWKKSGGLGSDLCNTGGCIFDLCIQLIIIMVVKAVASNIIQNLIPILKEYARRIYTRRIRVPISYQLAFYQEEYLKEKTEHFFLVDEYVEMVIQYGFVIFFVAGFPLAPFFALVNNIFEIRTDASKLTKLYRRPIPKKVTGLGAWFSILQAATYIGVVTNAFVIAFTSSAVEFEMYRFGLVNNEGGYVNNTISAFDVKDFVVLRSGTLPPIKYCYYPGKRYPPDHPEKYELTKDFWYILGMRFLIVVIFEHIIIIGKGILAYAIPDIPKSVSLELEEKRRAKVQRRN